MKISQCVGCQSFPCRDVDRNAYIVPGIEVDPRRVRIVLISEAAPPDTRDYYYARGNPAFAQTTLQAFNDAGADAASITDLVKRGLYFTTAVKCGKTGYGLQSATIKECSRLLEQEINLFPNVKAFLLMGDVAIKAVNYIAARSGERASSAHRPCRTQEGAAGAGRVIPAGSTYKIRGGKFHFRGARVYPSYLQAGPSFNIEKSKRRMIAEDLASALRLLD